VTLRLEAGGMQIHATIRIGGSVRYPFGHRWAIATHVEDVPAEEIERRIASA
jgi:hypothetical protein